MGCPRTAREIKVKINSVDRTSKVQIPSIIIEDILSDQTKYCSFVIPKGAGLGLVGLQEVVISNDAEDERYFAGVITFLKDERYPGAANKVRFDLGCDGFSWYLDHAEDLITGKYTDKSDQWLIQNVIAPAIPDIDCTTDVDEVLASIDFIEFDGDTPRKALERLKERAGADFKVDSGPGAGGKKANLHYFASGANAAPFSLSDDPDCSASYDYRELKRIDQVPDVNWVKVVGRNASEYCFYATTQDSEQSTLQFTGCDAITCFVDTGQDFSDWETAAPGTAQYIIIVQHIDGAESWAYLGDAWGVSADRIQVYTDIGLTSDGWNGASQLGKTPASYVVIAAQGDYGYWIKYKITDNALITLADLRTRGNQFLADVAAGVRCICFTFEPGLESGQDITLVNATQGINTSLMIRRVMTEFVALDHTNTTWYTRNTIEMGARKLRQADVLVGGRNIWDEEKFLPRRPGLIEQEDAGTDVQAKHYLDTYNDQVDYPPMQAMRKSHNDTLGTKTATIDTEELGYWPVYGVESGGDWQLAGYMKLIQDGAAGAGSIDAYWKIDPAIQNAGGDPYVVGPASSTDNAIARWDGTGGDTLQDSGITIDDSDKLVTPGVIELDFPSGDPIIIFDTQGADKFTLGVDDSDGDDFKLNDGGSLADYSLLHVSATADWTFYSRAYGGPVLGLYCYNTTDTFAPLIEFYKSSSGTLGTEAATVDEEHLGELYFYGVDSGGSFAEAAGIIITQEGAAAAGGVGGCLELYVNDDVADKVGYLMLEALSTTTSALTFETTNAILTGAGFLTLKNTAGCGIELKVYNASDVTSAWLEFYKSASGTMDTPLETGVDESFGGIIWYGYDNGNNLGIAACIRASQDGASGTGVPGNLELYACDNTSTINCFLLLDGPTDTIITSGDLNVGADCDITGTLTKGGGAFKIDHPLMPDTHWLYHSMVESPDMKNIYDGLVKLDKNGMAWVNLPAYFEALNRDYRYQLTPIGKAMTMLYIADEVDGNRFLIAGGQANGLVSWQVTGIRQDRFANDNRIQVEVRKTDD